LLVVKNGVSAPSDYPPVKEAPRVTVNTLVTESVAFIFPTERQIFNADRSGIQIYVGSVFRKRRTKTENHLVVVLLFCSNFSRKAEKQMTRNIAKK
jgi:hypothetical protein